MVFAGYPGPMAHFMAQNEGLFRRIHYTFDFQDCSCSELAEILRGQVERKGYELESSLLRSGNLRLASIIERGARCRAPGSS